MSKFSAFIQSCFHALSRGPESDHNAASHVDAARRAEADRRPAQEVILPHDPPPDTVVSWSDDSFAPLPGRPIWQRCLPMTARLSFLGLAAVVLWWSWPRADDAGFGFLALLTGPSSTADAATLAVVNPANVAAPTAASNGQAAGTVPTDQAAWFNNIVVVTPTSPAAATQAAGAQTVAAAPTLVVEPQANQTGIILESAGATNDDQPTLITLEIPNGQAVPAVASRSKEEAAAVPAELVLLPTATPGQDGVASLPVPKVQIIPAAGVRFTPTPEPPAATATPSPSPTATPLLPGPGRLWSTFRPKPPAENDHFWVGDPFAGMAANRFASPSYQFGSTAGNRYRPHHGVDISNPSGTPVQAAVNGVVIHAGPDDPDILGPYPNFYGKAVVIRLDQRLPVAGGEMDVLVLYGHLSDVRVEVGQRVQPTDIIGAVGMTGIAIGPHLHLEMRLGANTYDHSVNPYLWAQPAPGNGAVAVRILTQDGRTWTGAKVSIARFEGGKAVWARQIETYLGAENFGPDPAWGENGAMGDVPAGAYYLIANIAGESLRYEFQVKAGETSFVELRTQQ